MFTALLQLPPLQPFARLYPQFSQANRDERVNALRGKKGHAMKTIRKGLMRRGFMKQALLAAGAAGASGSLLADDGSEGLSKGDAALLRFAAAAEILESDFWIQ